MSDADHHHEDEHAHAHAPAHAHGAGGASRNRLLAALALTATFLIVEVVAGLVSGSLALLSDAAGSVAAIVAALLILLFGWTIADPITSIVISALILIGAWRLLRDATHVLMEGVPGTVDVAALERVTCQTPGVSAVHDLHVWS